MTAAAEVLNRAAQSVESKPAPRLKPHQWLYYRFCEYAPDSGLKTSDSWIRMDGMQDADTATGKLVIWRHSVAESKEGTPLGAYELLASLPTDPHAMIAALREKVGSEPRGSGLTRDELAYANIQQLLWNSPMGAPPRIEAALYRALAQQPGIQVRTGFQYAPGRTAIAVFTIPRSAMLLDPRTYQVIGSVNVSTGARPSSITPHGSGQAMKNSPVPPAGTVISSMFRDRVTFVDAPGRR